MMEAARTSEKSVDNYFTRQYVSEDNSKLHTRRRENLKSHKELQDQYRSADTVTSINIRRLEWAGYVVNDERMVKRVYTGNRGGTIRTVRQRRRRLFRNLHAINHQIISDL
jgi:hypothetical protein